MQQDFFKMGGQTIDSNLVAGVDYIEIEDGNGFKHKVVNLANEKYCKRSGVIELEAMRLENKHKNDKRFRRVLDKQTGLIWGIPVGIDPATKGIMWRQIIMENHMSFNLAHPEEARLWAVIKNSFYVEGSPNQNGRATWKVKDRERSAEIAASTRSKRRQAEDIIEAMNEKTLKETALNLGVNIIANSSMATLTEELYRHVEKAPQDFLDLMNDPRLPYKTILNRGLDAALITRDLRHDTYNFNGVQLGIGKQAAIQHLADNPNLATTILTKCDRLADETLKNIRQHIINTPDNANDRESAYKAEIETLKAQLAAKSEPVEFKDPFSEMKDERSDEFKNEELNELRERAKILKIKGYALMTEDKLKEKIAELEPK